MRGVPYGLRPCKVRNLSNSTVQKRGIVGNDPCVVPCRSNVTYRLTKERLTQVRQPHSAPNFHLPNQPKTSPVTPPLIKNETKFLPLSGGVTGEVLGGCGRFGGRGTPLSRGVPLPPRSFPHPSKVFPLPHSPLQSKGSEGGVTENGFQSGQQVTGYGERAPKQNAAGETAAAVKRQIRAVGIYLP